MWFELSLVKKGLIEATEFVAALDRHFDSRPVIGQLALEKQLLTIGQIFEILNVQASENESFGEIAAELGYLTRKDLAELLILQNDRSVSLRDCLVAMEAIDKETLDRELAKFRRELVFQCDERIVTTSV